MAAAETVKKTAEQFSAATTTAFKDGVEKSLASLNEINAHSKQNLEALVASVTAATKGAEALGSAAVAYTKKTTEANIAAAKSFAGVKSVQEAMELQSAWAKSSLEGYIAEVTKMGETLTASVKESLTPLNARVTAAVEKLQAVR